MLMRERGTGVSSLPLNTECHLLGIKYRPEYPAINLILQLIGLMHDCPGPGGILIRYHVSEEVGYLADRGANPGGRGGGIHPPKISIHPPNKYMLPSLK